MINKLKGICKKSNIILKISAISVILIMLVCLMQIQIKKEKINSVGEVVNIDYTLRYVGDANFDGDAFDSGENKYYKVYYDYTNDTENAVEMTADEINSLGIDYAYNSGGNCSVYVDGTHYPYVKINAMNIKSSQSVAFEVKGNANLTFSSDFNHYIGSTYNSEAGGYYGIKANAGLLMRNYGKLTIACKNDEITGDKECVGIKTDGELYIYGDSGKKTDTLTIDAEGRNGTGICSDNAERIYMKDIGLIIYAGNKGDIAGISGPKGIYLDGVTIGRLECSSTDGKAYGIVSTSDHTEGDINDYVYLCDGYIDKIQVKSDVEGALIKSNEIKLYEGHQVINGIINGKNVSGFNAVGKENESVRGIIINENSKVNIKGDVTGESNIAALYAQNSDVVVDNSNINIELDNTTDSKKIRGILATNDTVTECGKVVINSGMVKSKVSGNAGVSIETQGELSVLGGNVIACSKGQGISCSSFKLNTTQAPYTKVIAVATDMEANNIVEYDVAELNTYKYIQIGTNYGFSLEFDATLGVLSKVEKIEVVDEITNNVTIQEKKTVITSTDVPGWEIVDETIDDTEKKVLVLANFNFSTTSSKGIDIKGDGVVRLKENSQNSITIADAPTSEKLYGIVSYSGDLKCVGEGSLKVNIYGEGQMIYGIFSNGNMDISGGNYEILVRNNGTRGVGICSNTKNITISNARISDSVNSTISNAYYSTISGYRDVIISNSQVNIDIELQKYVEGISATDGKIEIKGTIVNIKESSSNGTYGIYTNSESDIIIDNSKLNMELVGGYAVYGVYAGTCDLITKNNSTINIKTQGENTEVLYAHYGVNMSDTVIDIDVESSGTNRVVGLYCYNEYEENEMLLNNVVGKIVINTEEDNYGIRMEDGTASAFKMNNCNLEITAKHTINIAPSFTNCSLTEGKSGDTTDRPGVVADVSDYNYVLIEPNYYLRYESLTGKMYINDTATEASVAGWSAKEVTTTVDEVTTTTYHLVLDGFNFTTNNENGLILVGDTVIEVKDGSENKIKNSYYGTNNAYGINSSNDINILGEGKLDIDMTNHQGTGYGIYTIKSVSIEEATLNINDLSDVGNSNVGVRGEQGVTMTSVMYDFDSIGKQGEGIHSCSGNINISKSAIYINIDNATKGQSVGIYSCAGAIDIENESIIDIEIKSTARDLTSSFIDAQGAIFAKNYMNAQNSEIIIKLDAVRAKIIETRTGNIIINNTQIKVERFNVSEQTNSVIYAGVDLDIKGKSNVYINLVCTENTSNSSTNKYIHYQEIVYSLGNISVTESDVTIEADMYCGSFLTTDSGSLSISKSNITVDAVTDFAYGIGGLSTDISGSTILLECNTKTAEDSGKKKYIEGIYSWGEQLNMSSVNYTSRLTGYDLAYNIVAMDGDINITKSDTDLTMVSNEGYAIGMLSNETENVNEIKIDGSVVDIIQTLKAEAEDGVVKKQGGIISEMNGVTIINGSKININGTANAEYTGICSEKSGVNINTKSYVDIVITCPISYGIRAKSENEGIALTNADINIVTNADESVSTTRARGIYANYNININTCNINIDNKAYSITGISTGETLYILSSKINICTASDTVITSVNGVYASNMSILDSDLDIVATKGNLVGIYVYYENLESINTNIEILVKKNNNYSQGMYVYEEVIIQGGKVDISVKEGSTGYEYGICTCYGRIRFDNCYINMNLENGVGFEAQFENSSRVNVVGKCNIVLETGQNIFNSDETDSNFIMDDIASKYGVVCVSKEYNGETLTEYNEEEIFEYKYIVIGEVTTYELKYDVNSGKIYEVGSNEALTVDEIAEKGMEIDSVNNTLILTDVNISTDKEVALWIIGDIKIKVNNSEGKNNNFVTSGGTESNYYGIKIVGDATVTGNSTIKCDKTSSSDIDENYYGVYSTKDITFIKGELDIAVTNAATKGNTIGLYAANVNVNGGDTKVEVDADYTTAYGIECEKDYNSKSGRMNIVLDKTNANTNGLKCGNIINNNDGTLEVTAKNVMNKQPTINTSRVSMSEARNGETITRPGVASKYAEYDYVRIEPHYYLKYKNNKMYINETEELADVTNWSVNGSNELVLDGFIFTTSALYGINTATNTSILIGENYDSLIYHNYSGTGDSRAIHANGALTLKGAGKLKVKSMYSKGINRTLMATSTLNITNAKIDIVSHTKKYIGIYSGGKMTFNNAKVNFVDVYTTNEESNAIYSNNGLDILNGSDVDIKYKTDEKTVVSWGYRYTNYIVEVFRGNLVVSKSNIYMNIDMYSGRGMTTFNGDVFITDNSLIKMDVLSDEYTGIHSFDQMSNENKGYTHIRGGSVIDISINQKENEESKGAYVYALASELDMNITESSVINIIHNSPKRRFVGLNVYGKITINNAYVDIGSSNTASTAVGMSSSEGMSISNGANIVIDNRGSYGVGINSSGGDVVITGSNVDITCHADMPYGMQVYENCIINDSIVDFDLKANKSSFYESEGEMVSYYILGSIFSRKNIEITNTVVNNYADILDGAILFAYGDTKIDNSDILFNDITTKSYTTEMIYSEGDIDIINDSLIDIGFTSTADDTKVDADDVERMYIQSLIKAKNRAINVNNSSVIVDASAHRMNILDAPKGAVTVNNSTLDIDNAIDSGSAICVQDNIEAELMEGAGNINIISSIVDIDTTSMSDTEVASAKEQKVIMSDCSDINISNNSDIDITVDSNTETIGLYSKIGNINVESNSDLDINLKSTNISKGIFTDAEDKSVTIDSSKADIYAGDDEDASISIDTKNLVVSGGSTQTSTVMLEASKKYKDIRSTSYGANELVKYPGKNDLSYKYIKIGEVPSYYYRFDGLSGVMSKVLKDGSSTVLNELPTGMEVPNTEKILNLTGFDFVTTAKCAIETVNSATINIEDNKSNTITLLYTGAEDSYAIYGQNPLIVQCVDDVNRGSLKIINKNNKKNTGAIYSTDTLIFNNANIVLEAQVPTYKGINTANKVTFNNTILNATDIKTDTHDSNIIKANAGIDILSSSDIDIHYTDKEDETHEYTNDDNETEETFTYNQGIIEANNNINISESAVTIMTNVYSGYGIVSYDGNIDIFKGDIDMTATADLFYGIFAHYKNQVCGTSSLGVIDVDESFVDITVNHLDSEDYVEGVSLGFNTTYNNLNLTETTVNLIQNSRYYSCGLKSQEGNMNIEKSNITMTSSRAGGFSCEGLIVTAKTTNGKTKGKLTIDDSDVVIDVSEYYMTTGLYTVYGNLKVTQDSYVKVKSECANAYGIISYKDFEVESSEVIFDIYKDEDYDDSIAHTYYVRGVSSITDSTLNITARGVYATGIEDGGGMNVISSDVDVVVIGEDADLNMGVKMTGDITLTSSDFNVIVSGPATKGVHTKGNMTIKDSNVDVDGSSDKLVGVTTDKNYSIDNSTVSVRAGKQAMDIKGTYTNIADSTTINEASTIYKDIKTNPYISSELISYPDKIDTDYRYVKIIPVIISVDIIWGALNYEFHPGTWNEVNHNYDGRGWKAVDENGNISEEVDKIKVVNNSNVPLNTTFLYTPESEYASINGKIVKDRELKEQLLSPSQILRGGNIETYLLLEGTPTKDMDKEKLGKVTIGLY